MKDIEIKISQETRMVDLKKTVLGNDAENLQGNLIFSFADNFVNGTARLEYEISGNKRYIMLEKNNNTYSVPIKSVLTKKGQINMQLVITEGTSENDIPIFKSNIFYVFCNQSINAEIEQPDEYPSWIEIANAKINEIDEAILGIEEAKRYAVEQGDYAKEQGDYAKAQGDYAKTQKIEVVKANEEANKIISDFEKNVDEYTTSFNDNAINKTNDFDRNVESKTSKFNVNADSKISSYNTNASEKLNTYNTNSNNKIKEYNDNAISNTTAFNDNASNKTTYYNNNATTKLNEYNTNAANKTNEFNTNATSKINDYNTNATNKTTEYNTNADNKIAEYDLHSQELNNKIIDTRNELERVKNDVLETGTDTDTFIHLEDSAMAEYQELSVDGVCEQKTTTGKQLLPPNFAYKTQTIQGITFTDNGDGSLTLNGTSTGSPVYYLTYNSPITIPSSKVALRNFNAINGINLRALIEGGSITDNNGNGSISDKELTTINNIYIFVAQGITLKDVKIKPMVCLNEIPNLYEPFTNRQPSPSPDYPQEIKTIENSLKIISCNKNLFDKENGITENKGLNEDGTTFDSSASSIKDFIKVEPNTSYVFGGGTDTTHTKRICMYNEKNKPVVKTIEKRGTKISFTTTEDTHYIKIQFKTDEIDNMQLKKGIQETPFEEHLETQITANLPEGEFIGKINETYKDTLKVEYNEEDGQYHLVLNKMIGKVVLDGSENIGISKTETNTIYIYSNLIDSLAKSETGLSNRFRYVHKNTLWTTDEIGFSIDNSGINYLRFRLPISLGRTIDEIKTWLSTNNVEVYYILAEPYTLDLGVVDQLITYNEITNLFTDSDLMPQINAKYYRNFISTVRNLQINEKALKQELIDINNRLSALETAQTSVASESEVIE